jgi:peroxiredoxin
MEQILVVSMVLLWIVVLFNLLLTLVLIRQRQSQTRGGGENRDMGGLKAGQAAPDFTASTLQGEVVTQATFSGSPAAFIFVGPHCGPSREAIPSYQGLYPRAKQAGVELMLVSTGSEEETKALVAEMQITMPVLAADETTNSFMKDYNLRATPTYCLVDGNGKVVASGFPSADWGEWKRIISSWEHAPAGAVPLRGAGEGVMAQPDAS